MGFRTGAYATVWSVESVSPTMTKSRISITRKNRNTDQYEQEFGGYIAFVGTAAAGKALRLREKDRIKLGDVDVTNTYNKERNVTYTNFKVFSFEGPDELNGGSSGGARAQGSVESYVANVGDGEIDENLLPF